MGQAGTSVLAEKLVRKAIVKLDAARELFQKKFYEDSASRAYYAMFHAARAMLTQKGVTAKTHEGTVSEFGRNYVVTGIMPRELGKALAEAKATRETFEYSVTAEITRQEAEAVLEDAENFVLLVQMHFQRLHHPVK